MGGSGLPPSWRTRVYVRASVVVHGPSQPAARTTDRPLGLAPNKGLEDREMNEPVTWPDVAVIAIICACTLAGIALGVWAGKGRK